MSFKSLTLDKNKSRSYSEIKIQNANYVVRKSESSIFFVLYFYNVLCIENAVEFICENKVFLLLLTYVIYRYFYIYEILGLV